MSSTTFLPYKPAPNIQKFTGNDSTITRVHLHNSPLAIDHFAVCRHDPDEGDAVFVARGYHPNVSIPGSTLNFL